MKSAILNEISHNGIDKLDIRCGFCYKDAEYDLNIYDYAEYGKDAICVVAYPIEKVSDEYVTNHSNIVANIFLDKKEWLQLSHVYKQHTKMKALQYSYLQTDAEIDELFKELIKNGYSYQFEQQGGTDCITKNAVKIIFNATACLKDNIEIGYLLKVDSQGIQIFTRDKEIIMLDYDFLDDTRSKLTVIEKLIGY